MLKSVSWKKLVQKLRKLGFDGPFSGGRHLFMIKDKLKLHIPNPHRGDISKDLLSEILKQGKVSKDEWSKE